MTWTAAVLVVTVLATVPTYAADGAALLILPFDNVSGAAAAPQEIAARVARMATARGWRVVDGNVDELLELERVRYLDAIEDGPREKLLAATGASALLTGTIYTYNEQRNPVVALSVRLVRADGSVAWTQIGALSADQTDGLFGFGRKSDVLMLSDAAVRTVLRSFPAPEKTVETPQGPSKPLLLQRVSAFRSEAANGREPRRVCVLPFHNESSSPEAARIVFDALSVRLAARSGFEVVGPEELRKAARDVRVGSFRGISNDDLTRLGSRLRTTLFVRGTIYRFSETGGTGDPSIDLEMSMVDVATSEVVWAVQHERRGSDYEGLLLLGGVTSGVELADRVVSEITVAKGKDAPRAAQAFVAARTARHVRNAPTKTSEILDSKKSEGTKK